ncbi:helix-hairpin-helix domain-containing protein [Marinifilum flexuosum]|uniref:Helix-hairpin-helix DNA-binding motif class 1 domain-containing protein n=1 Tax=Marinifilum flexuosum TaxID=1117708 RepID=A0A419WMT9_9BACT|nr:helix-hairpin-helix domain-containing protein [Marinifilum flexuosum]RKD96779.1 hypothetical protein BXY64_3726 [Marinifilum flexuosum]
MKGYKVLVTESCVMNIGGDIISVIPGVRTLSLKACHALINAGYAEAIEGEELPELPKEEKKPEPPKDGELPLDFPSRDLLIENDLTTIEAVKAFGDLTEIEGIGPKKAEEILEALK